MQIKQRVFGLVFRNYMTELLYANKTAGVWISFSLSHSSIIS